MQANVIGLVLTCIAIENLFRIHGLILAQFPLASGNVNNNLREVTVAIVSMSVLLLFTGSLGFWAEQPPILVGGSLLLWSFWTIAAYLALRWWGAKRQWNPARMALVFAYTPLVPLVAYGFLKAAQTNSPWVFIPPVISLLPIAVLILRTRRA